MLRAVAAASVAVSRRRLCNALDLSARAHTRTLLEQTVVRPRCTDGV